jgi:hypothetical protein
MNNTFSSQIKIWLDNDRKNSLVAIWFFRMALTYRLGRKTAKLANAQSQMPFENSILKRNILEEIEYIESVVA